MRTLRLLVALVCFCVCSFAVTPASDSVDFYGRLQTFTLQPSGIAVTDLSIERQGVVIRFTGSIFPEQAIDGRQYGAVLVGNGSVQYKPKGRTEEISVKRFLKTTDVSATFRTAILRFTDDTAKVWSGVSAQPTALDPSAAKRASELNTYLARNNGLNLAARVMQSVTNGDDGTIFFADFDGGKPGHFDLLIDLHCRSVESAFNLDAGEKVVLFENKGLDVGADVWTAAFSDDEYKTGSGTYSDSFDVVRVSNYKLDVDMREAPGMFRETAEIQLSSLQDGVRVLPLRLNDGFDNFDNERRKHGLKITEAIDSAGTSLRVVQLDTEEGATIVLANPLRKDEKLTLRLTLEAKNPFFTFGSDFHYPLATTSWYPRHSLMQKSTFDLTFHTKKGTQAASVGKMESRVAEGKEVTTRWVSDEPLWFASFAVGPFEVHSDKVSVTGRSIPIDYYSAPGSYAQIKEDFMVAELMNSVNFYGTLFTAYPYQRLGAAFSPRSFGQGFPTLLMLPKSDYSDSGNFSFISHEVAHQWFGNLVRWRSYRDQWLSEGFAEYVSQLYAWNRDKHHNLDRLNSMRRYLMFPAGTEYGLSGQKLYEVGPIAMGYRLDSRVTRGAYVALTYNKGALVLRMLHLLFTNHSTGDDTAFFDMMKKFLTTYSGGVASTDDFQRIASQEFAKTPIAQKYGLKDLNWFFSEWVYGTALPTYKLQYSVAPIENGGVLLSGTVTQINGDEKAFMPLPLQLTLKDGKSATAIVAAYGPSTPFKIKLPTAPDKVQLDPFKWVLSEKTE